MYPDARLVFAVSLRALTGVQELDYSFGEANMRELIMPLQFLSELHSLRLFIQIKVVPSDPGALTSTASCMRGLTKLTHFSTLSNGPVQADSAKAISAAAGRLPNLARVRFSQLQPQWLMGAVSPRDAHTGSPALTRTASGESDQNADRTVAQVVLDAAQARIQEDPLCFRKSLQQCREALSEK